MRTLLLILPLSLAALLVSQPAPREQVGPLPSGGFLLNSGWRIKPAGNHVPVSTLPMSTALSPDGRFLLVLNGGYNPPSISVLAMEGMKEISRVPVADGWLGLTFSPSGRLVYVGGGARNRVYEFAFSAQGELTPSREFDLAATGAQPSRFDFAGDVAVSPDGRLIYAAEVFHDSIAVINVQPGPQSGRAIEH